MSELARVWERMPRPRQPMLVVGDVMLDRYTWGNAERVSPEAPVVVLRVDHREVRLGGAASVATRTSRGSRIPRIVADTRSS